MATKGIPADAHIVFWGEKYDVYQWPQKMFDGSVQTFERLAHKDSVKVIPVLDDKTIMMIKEEQPGRPAFVGFPGGGIEVNESPEAAARRELQEETGFVAKELIPWMTFDLFGGIAWEMHVFIAKGLEKHGDATPDAGEKIEPFFITFNQFIGLVEEDNYPNLREDGPFRETLIRAYYNEEKRNEIKDLLYT